MAKYAKHIPKEYWFDYKDIKQQIKYILHIYSEFVTTQDDKKEECCICLEDTGNMMHTLCCNKQMHYSCYLNTIMYSSYLCPLCRSNCVHHFTSCSLSARQEFDKRVMALLSKMCLNIKNIETVVNKRLIKDPDIMSKYCSINYTAVVKICKKIFKYLHIDFRQYCVEFMKKAGINLMPMKPKDNILVRWLMAYKKKLNM